MAFDQKEGAVREAGESYTFQYSEQELRAIAKDGCASLIRRTAVISDWLFVLSVLSIFGAIFVVSLLSEITYVMTEHMWVFFLFLPIPLASFAFGFRLKKKGYDYKKNVIAGIIVAALLCVFGSFTFIFSDFYSHSDEPLLEAEQILQIDIPKHRYIYTQDFTKLTSTQPSREDMDSVTNIYFDGDAEEDRMVLVEYLLEYVK